jgi:hypothetical protein
MFAPCASAAAFVVGNWTRDALPAEAAVRREDEMLRVDVFERATHVCGDRLGRLDGERAMADEPTATVFGSAPLYGSKSERGRWSASLDAIVHTSALRRLEVNVDRVLIRGVRVEAVLRARVASAGVDPDHDVVETLHMPVQQVDEEGPGACNICR